MIDDWREKLPSLIDEVLLQTVDDEFYRVVPKTAAAYVLEDGPSYRYQNRYNVAEKFGALYFADNPEVCYATLEKRGHLLSRRVPHVIIRFRIKCEKILNLTDLTSLGKLGININLFLQSTEIPEAYRAPQDLATIVFHTGKVNGLIAPDVTHTGNTMVLYPSKILATDHIKIIEEKEL